MPAKGLWKKRITSAWMSCGKVDDIPLQVKALGQGRLQFKQKGHRVTFPAKAGLLELKKETSNPFAYYGKPKKAQKGVKKAETPAGCWHTTRAARSRTGSSPRPWRRRASAVA